MQSKRLLILRLFVCLLFIISSLSSALIVNPPDIPRNFTSAGTYYHSSGNNAYFAVDQVMTFSQVVVDSTYVEFNDTKFNITSPNRINISLDYLGTTMTGTNGTVLVSFYAQTTVGTAYFSINGFSTGIAYEVFKNNVSMATPIANATGWIHFNNNVWTTAYFEIAMASGSIASPTVTTNVSTGVEETNTTLRGTLTDDGGAGCTVGFNYGLTTGYGTTVNVGGGTSNYSLALDYPGDELGWNYNLTFPKDIWDNNSIAVNDSCENFAQVGGIWDTVTSIWAHNLSASPPNDWSSWVKGREPLFNTLRYMYSDSSKPNFEFAIHTTGACNLFFNYDYNNFTLNFVSGWNGPFTLPSTIWDYNSSILVNDSVLNFVTKGGIYSHISDVVAQNLNTGAFTAWNKTYPEFATLHNMSNLADNPRFKFWFYVDVPPATLFFNYDIPHAVSLPYAYSINVNSLTPGKLYHYRAYATNSNGTGYGSDMTFITKPNEPTALSATSFSNKTIILAWTKGTGANNTMVRQKTGSYPTSISDGDLVYNGTGSTATNSSLSPGQRYFYRAWSYAGWGTSCKWSDLYSSDVDMTKPSPITNASSTLNWGTMKINLSWDKDTSTNKTVILAKATGFPTSISDGTIIYNGTGDFTLYSFVIGTTYYFKAWSYANWSTPAMFAFSTNGTTFIVNGTGGLFINCFDEINNTNLTFNVLITNQNGTQTYVNTSCTNTLVINETLCPQGLDTILISATGYQQRSYILNIYTGMIYILNARLVPIVIPTPGGTPETNLSYLFVITVVGEQYEYGTSPPIEGVKVTIKRYINTTGIFSEVGSMITDANGQCSIYLQLNVLYKIICNKTGFYDSTTDFITDINIRTKTLRIHFIVPGIPTYQIFNDIIIFNAVMYNGSFILINYDDTNHTTIDTQIYVYEIYNNTRTLVFTFTRVGEQTFQENATPINKSRTYLVELFYNNSNVFDMTSPIYLTVLPIELFNPGFSKPDFNDRINKIFGSPEADGVSLGTWWTVITVALALILLCSFGPFNTAFGIMASGVSVLGVQGLGAILFVNTANLALAGIGAVVIFIGIIYWMTKGEVENTL